MSTAAAPPAIPDLGRLEETPLPRLLLDLQRAKLSGSLVLRQAHIEKQVELREGSPVLVESNRSTESLLSLLAESGKISADQRESAERMMRTQQCKEVSALLSLKGGFVGMKHIALARKPPKIAVRHAGRAEVCDFDGKIPNIASQVFGVVVSLQQEGQPLFHWGGVFPISLRIQVRGTPHLTALQSH